MNLELIKSLILTILVGLSLLLTFSLWNYKPDYELYYPQSTYVNEVDLGGIESSKNTIIQPTSFIYHKKDEVLGFSEAKIWRSLYREIQQWSFANYSLGEYKEVSPKQSYIEINFPVAIPMDMVKYLFTLDDDEVRLPSWSFQQVILTVNSKEKLINVYFRSIDKRQQVRYTVHDNQAYEQLVSSINDQDNIVPYMAFDDHSSIYVPTEPLEMKRRSLSIISIEPTLLVNALFSNPSLVSPNVGEAYFTDGQRGMRLTQEGRSMEFINPIHASEEELMDINELLELSVAHINGHKGWTDIYTLSEVSEGKGILKFQMEYEGYPVHGSGNLSTIEQQWHNHELRQYVRPLFSLNNILGVEDVHIPSGKDIIFYLENNEQYDVDKIKDIQIGYRLSYLDRATYSVILDPSWYVYYKGNWQEINLDNADVHEEGGA